MTQGKVMPSDVWAECPNCPTVAKNKTEIDGMFGWRWVPRKDDPNAKQIPQSHCYACRDAGKFSKIGKGN